jgi:hypothetical protein
LPTNLPRPSVKPKLSIFTLVLNTFMLGSALILTAAVVLQEQRYAIGQPDTVGALVQPVAIDMTNETMALPPSN